LIKINKLFQINLVPNGATSVCNKTTLVPDEISGAQLCSRLIMGTTRQNVFIVSFILIFSPVSFSSTSNPS
jgi:hypothetical protein